LRVGSSPRLSGKVVPTSIQRIGRNHAHTPASADHPVIRIPGLNVQRDLTTLTGLAEVGLWGAVRSSARRGTLG
jgi:hypothetical protein